MDLKWPPHERRHVAVVGCAGAVDVHAGDVCGVGVHAEQDDDVYRGVGGVNIRVGIKVACLFALLFQPHIVVVDLNTLMLRRRDNIFVDKPNRQWVAHLRVDRTYDRFGRGRSELGVVARGGQRVVILCNDDADDQIS